MEIQKIAEGNTAEVFTWGENDILKLFRKDFPMSAVEQEYRISKAVEKLGVQIPKGKDIVEYEGRTGIVYERITGISLLDLISKKPWTSGKYAKIIAQMHYDMHRRNAEGLPECKESLRWRIEHAKELDQKQREAVLEVLKQLPEGSSVCHGDYHPGNILKDSDRYVILDWMTATAGQPGYDVARTLYLLKDSAIPDYIPGPVRVLMNRVRRSLAGKYLKQYRSLSGMPIEEIEAWRLPLIAGRLTEWVPEYEREALLTEIKEKTGVK